MRIGTAKLREQINRHLETLKNGPHVRAEQIRLCYMIVDLQEEVDRRNREAMCRKLLREQKQETG